MEVDKDMIIVSRYPFAVSKANKKSFKYKRRSGKKCLQNLEIYRKYYNGIVTVDVVLMSKTLGIPNVYDIFCPADKVYITRSPFRRNESTAK